MFEDDANMRALLGTDDPGSGFDNLRKTYRKRREFTNTVLSVPQNEKELRRILEEFKFNIG